jgi:hypothetical protein
MLGGSYENNMVILVGFSSSAPIMKLFGGQKKVAALRKPGTN